MIYQLRYRFMCSVDGSVGETIVVLTIHAKNDIVAIEDANEHLKSERSGLAIPWGPMLYEGERLVAKSDPGYLPNAHYLSWVGDAREPQNSFQDLVNEVCQEFQDDFILFVDKGETNLGYLAHIDCCPKCNVAVEKAFKRMAMAFEGFVRHLRTRSNKK